MGACKTFAILTLSFLQMTALNGQPLRPQPQDEQVHNSEANKSRSNVIIDMFMYNGEPIVGWRLELLHDVVHEFVIVESLASFSLKRVRQHHFSEEHADLFEPYKHKITFLRIDRYPDMSDTSPKATWEREAYARNYATDYLMKKYDPNRTIVVSSDADEIWNPEITNDLRDMLGQPAGPVALALDYLHYNFLWYFKEGQWTSSKAVNLESLTRDNTTFQSIRPHNAQYLTLPSAGWHCTYFLSVRDIAHKLVSFSHQELNKRTFKNPRHVWENIMLGRDLFNRKEFPLNLYENHKHLPTSWKGWQIKISSMQLDY